MIVTQKVKWDLSDYKRGMLTAIRREGRTPSGQHKWLFRCVCGEYINLAPGSALKKKTGCGRHTTKAQKLSGAKISKSKTRNIRHYRSPEHNSWRAMRERCYNKNNTCYNNYGGRGIKVCKRWDSFNNFYKDMGNRPSKKHSLDRIDNDGDYSPDNCRWATRLEQNRNQRSNIYVTVYGVKMLQTDALTKYKINCASFYKIIKVRGLTPSGAIHYYINNKHKRNYIIEDLPDM